MAKAYVTELTRLSTDANGQPIQAADLSAFVRTQVVDFTGAATATALVFADNTRFVMINVDSICSFKEDTSPVATTSDARLPADALVFFGVAPGQKISFVINT